MNVLGVQPVLDAKIMCLECGRWLGHLSMHLRTHGLDAASYRERFSLATSARLVPPSLRRLQAEHARKQYPSNIGLQRGPSASQLRRGVRAAAQARQENRDRAGFQRSLPEQIAERAASKRDNARRRYHELAKTAGYRGINDMLRRTWKLTDQQFGALLGLSESTGGYIRAHHGRRPEQERTGAQRRALQYTRAIDRRYNELAQAAGYTSIAAMLDQTRMLSHRKLGQLLGKSPQAAARLRADPSMARLRPGDGSPIITHR